MPDLDAPDARRQVVGGVALGYPAVPAQGFDLHAGLGCRDDQGAGAEGARAANDVCAFLGRRLAEHRLEVEVVPDIGEYLHRGRVAHGSEVSNGGAPVGCRPSGL